MPMNSIALLQTLLARAERERDTAAGVLRQAEQAEQNARLQAEGLQAYRSDYDQRWVAHFQAAASTTLLHCRHGFGQRLDQAIQMQSTNTQQLGNRVQNARSVLLAREQRVAAVRKLIERRSAELQAMANRREQRHTDEAAQRARATATAFGAGPR